MNSFTALKDSLFTAPYWEVVYFGNTLADYAIALIAAVVFLGVFKILQVVILARLRALAGKTATDIDDVVIKMIGSVRPPFYSFLAVYLALNLLVISPLFSKVLTAVLIIWMVYQVITVVQILIDYVVQKKLDGDDANAKSAGHVLGLVAKMILWTVGLLMILSNLGINITSLIAGLGVGGIAVALAVQNILGDLFSSFAIYFDKPFAVGDFIVVGDKMGTVEKIGIKTTRLRALQGEEVVMSNKELTSAVIQNFKHLSKRRVVFSFGVTYEIDNAVLKKVPVWVKEIIEKAENAVYDRVHMKSFGDSSLDFEAVYYVGTGDYTKYMDVQQEINFAIREKFEKEKVDMAYPTRTLYMQKMD